MPGNGGPGGSWSKVHSTGGGRLPVVGWATAGAALVLLVGAWILAAAAYVGKRPRLPGLAAFADDRI